MGYASNYNIQALAVSERYCLFSGATQELSRSLQNRDRSVRDRLIKNHIEMVKSRNDQFLIKRIVYRAALISGVSVLMAISLRIANHVVYFTSGVDYHILDGVFY